MNMIEVRVESKPAFSVIGKKTWISGQDNEQFGRFWKSSHESGLIERLRAHREGVPSPVTNSLTFGVSCVEKDPNDRAFFFYIATEQAGEKPDDMEAYTVPASEWAIFSNKAESGEIGMALVEAEMHAFMKWLPESPYRHAAAPEIEVYPPVSSVEFWLPIETKEDRA